jgi:hypothetical protein
VNQTHGQIYFLNRSNSYLTFHMSVYSHWYIHPTIVDLTGLSLNYIALDEPDRFKDLFRISLILFEYIVYKCTQI